MAEYTQNSLKTKIDADLADNQAGGITAETLRTTLKNMVDSVIPIVVWQRRCHYKFYQWR